MRSPFVAALASALLLAGLAGAADEADPWEELRTAAAAVRSLRADFVQEKRLPILARPLRSEGTLHYRRPDGLRWEYRTPIRNVLVMDGSRMERYGWSDGGWVAETGGRLEALRVVVDEIAAWMAGDFGGNDAFEARLEAGSPARIVMAPRAEEMRRYVRSVTVELSATPGVIDAVTIDEGEGASTRIVFRNVEVNPTLPEGIFRVVP